MPSRGKESFHNGKTGAALVVRVQPRASRDEIVEIQNDGTVKIRLKSPPVDGQANIALVQFLAKILDVPKTSLEIIAGQAGRQKIVTIFGVDAVYVEHHLRKWIT